MISYDSSIVNRSDFVVDFESHADMEKVAICVGILEQTQEFLDTVDLRLITGDDLRNLEKRISLVIGGVNKIQDKTLIPVRIRRYILQNSRNARSELFNALDSQEYTEKHRRVFYKCLTKCQAYLSGAVWKLRSIADIEREAVMNGLEPVAIAALTKAVDFLFDQAGKIMQERREKRKKLGEEDDAHHVEDTHEKSVESRGDLEKLEVKTIYLKDIHKEIEHCLKQIDQYRSNRRHTLEQIAYQGGMGHASIGVRNDLSTEESELKRLSQKLKTLVERAYGTKIAINGLD